MENGKLCEDGRRGLLSFTVTQDCAKLRIDKYLTERVEMTRSAIVILIDNGSVTVNGNSCDKNYKVRVGDNVEVNVPEPKKLDVKAEDIELDIVYEDDDLLVVNKKKGMVVHPAAGNYEGTLVNALMKHCGDNLSAINGVIRPGIVHRIDKDTSGLLIVAKSNAAHLGLASQIKEHSFLRVYNGIIYGHLKEKEGTVNLPIGRDEKNRKKMAVTLKNSKPAVTHYKVLAEKEKYSLVEFRLETGRTHQIRVHMAYLGHAIACDPLYSPKNTDKKMLTGQLLHAKTIGFIHPITGQYLEFTSDNPKEFECFI